MHLMLKEAVAGDGKGEEQTVFAFQLWPVKNCYKFACIDLLHLDGCSRAKHTKLKTSLIGKKILENSVIFVYSMARLVFI